MKRLKTFALYLFWLILFFVVSRVIIFIGLHSRYNNINIKGDSIDGISITVAKATSVNGQIKGEFSKEFNENEYIKLNFYTDIDTLEGSYYLNPSAFETKDFELFFKLNYIDYYTIELTDEIPEVVDSNSFSTTEFEAGLLLAAILMLMFV